MEESRNERGVAPKDYRAERYILFRFPRQALTVSHKIRYSSIPPTFQAEERSFLPRPLIRQSWTRALELVHRFLGAQVRSSSKGLWGFSLPKDPPRSNRVRCRWPLSDFDYPFEETRNEK